MRPWLKISLPALSALLSVASARAELTRAPLHGDNLVSGARDILTADEFTTEGEAASQSLLMRILDAIGEFLRNVFGGWGGLAGGDVLARIMLVILVAVVVLLLALVLSRFIQRRERRLTARAQADVREADVSTLTEWAGEAEQNGDYSRAFVLRFLILLKRCDEENLLEFNANRTNWEILDTRQAEHHTAFWKTVFKLGGKFDLVFYGGREAGAEDVAEIKDVIAAIPTTKGAAAA